MISVSGINRKTWRSICKSLRDGVPMKRLFKSDGAINRVQACTMRQQLSNCHRVFAMCCELWPIRHYSLGIIKQTLFHAHGNCQRRDSLRCGEHNLKRILAIWLGVVFVAPSTHQVNNALSTVIHGNAGAVFLSLFKSFKECVAHWLPTGSNTVNCEDAHDQASTIARSFSI